jgi:hypothetical protein
VAATLWFDRGASEEKLNYEQLLHHGSVTHIKLFVMQQKRVEAATAFAVSKDSSANL